MLIETALKKISENNILPPEGSFIAVAMSGGVDSSVAAALLAKMNYKVLGITGWLVEGKGKCCDGGMIDSARISETLGIQHEVQDLRELFKQNIINNFISSYAGGSTPVPCMPCNTIVKWGSLLEYSKELGAAYFASGHYARLMRDNDRYMIGKPTDTNKDQSYMLWGLSQDQLQRTVFPLANFTKDEIRELAREFGLNNWNKEESQDICFVPDKTKDFLEKHLGEKKGEIIHVRTKKVLGEHSGTHFYTIGQRKGIGLSSSEPIYVVSIDSVRNVVYVGGKSELFSGGLHAKNVNWQQKPSKPFEGLVKIRYNSQPVRSIIHPQDNSFEVEFLEDEVASVTKGQAAVIYDIEGNFVIGGGWISRAIDLPGDITNNVEEARGHDLVNI
jgi:tRNA-specific 2-thiouridylase